jgi:hypothetical protein
VAKEDFLFSGGKTIMLNKKVISIMVVLVLAALLLCSCAAEEAKTEESADMKTITVSVINGDETTELTIETDADNLRDALEGEGIIAGEESSYGLFVTTVNGVTADESKEEWWMISKDGESLQTGVDDTEIADGESYEFTLTVGW